MNSWNCDVSSFVQNLYFVQYLMQVSSNMLCICERVKEFVTLCVVKRLHGL